MAKGRVKVKGRFYVLLLSVLLVGALIFALIVNRDVCTADSGTLDLNIQASAVIIRNESTVSVERYDRVLFSVNEGASVAEGTAIAQVYKWGYSEDMMTSLLALKRQILAMQELLLADIENPNISTLELQIATKLEQIRSAVLLGSGEDLLALENELLSLQSQRIELLKTVVQPTTELNELYTEESDKQLQLMSWKSEIAAKQEGMVSFYFDGYEQALCVSKLSMINAELVSAVLSGSGNTTSTSDDMLYRIVDDTTWCVAFITPYNNPVRTVEGESYSVVLSGYTDEPYTGVALAPVISESGVVNILKITAPLGDLIDVRLESAEISSYGVSGVSVPIGAVGMDSGTPYVEVETSSGDYRVNVDVLAADDTHYIIRAADGAGSVSAGMRLKKK